MLVPTLPPEGINPDVLDIVSEDDRVWFEQNPSRRYRIRPPYTDEWIGAKITPESVVLVFEIYPGARARRLGAVKHAPARENTEINGQYLALILLPDFVPQ